MGLARRGNGGGTGRSSCCRGCAVILYNGGNSAGKRVYSVPVPKRCRSTRRCGTDRSGTGGKAFRWRRNDRRVLPVSLLLSARGKRRIRRTTFPERSHLLPSRRIRSSSADRFPAQCPCRCRCRKSVGRANERRNHRAGVWGALGNSTRRRDTTFCSGRLPRCRRDFQCPFPALSRSPEAQAAEEVFLTSVPRLEETLLRCGSGQELTDRGYRSDVLHAAQWNRYTIVPHLRENLRLEPLNAPLTSSAV